jgi:exoribonuclease R
MSRGALELEGTEVRFVLTPGTKNPQKICMYFNLQMCAKLTSLVTKQELEVNKMVAEFMIFANKSVAEKASLRY